MDNRSYKEILEVSADLLYDMIVRNDEVQYDDSVLYLSPFERKQLAYEHLLVCMHLAE